MATHYVTHIKVEKVETAPPPPAARGTWIDSGGVKPPGRTVTEVGSVTVKATSLAALAEKVGAHLVLFDGEVAE